jgi:hypothetical protein
MLRKQQEGELITGVDAGVAVVAGIASVSEIVLVVVVVVAAVVVSSR